MMEKLSENEIAPVVGADNKAMSAPAMKIGPVFREARERMGLSLEDVVGKIKLAPRQIIALEADDFQALPETAFLRGFVRSYAKLLQLEVQPLLDALPGAVTAAVESPHVDAPFPSERIVRRQNLNLLVAALLIAVVIAGFAVWQANSPPATEVAADAAMTATPLPLPQSADILDSSPQLAASAVPASEVPASAVPEAGLVPLASPPVVKSSLRLVFDKESWAEIKDQSGKTLSRQVNLPGSELRLEGDAPFTLVIGHAAAVHLYFREKPVDLSSYINASSDVARMTLE